MSIAWLVYAYFVNLLSFFIIPSILFSAERNKLRIMSRIFQNFSVKQIIIMLFIINVFSISSFIFLYTGFEVTVGNILFDVVYMSYIWAIFLFSFVVFVLFALALDVVLLLGLAQEIGERQKRCPSNPG